MAGSGEQRARPATLWRSARDGDGWAVAGCVLAPWYCAWQELSTTSGEYAEAAEQAAAEAVEGAREGMTDSLVDIAGAAAEPLHEAAEIAKWGAIALAVILALVLVLLGVVAWLYWGPAVKSALSGVGAAGRALAGGGA